MTKSKKDKSTKAKTSVKVQDLEPEKDPKAGYSWGVSGLKAGDGAVLKQNPTDGTSNPALKQK